ncbi:hypothetical protein GOBAR_AA08689 [Gossypium barbadense]|uniref:Uncharacterized protein n=1 Tax=Gossypium barbadense TaxID=3634 RepID=A0A2P5Y8L1_GOSBA|nr:hypothetical protein GOBAR_AA08689 [Gossypium barbadense]
MIVFSWENEMKDRDFTEVVPSNKLHESELDSERVKQKEMDNRVDPDRIPLARVVFQLVKVRFDDALKEAKAGDTNMQVLDCNGYGVPKDIQKVPTYASSVWKVSDKHPGGVPSLLISTCKPELNSLKR